MKKYMDPEVEITRFSVNDVMMVSGPTEPDELPGIPILGIQ